MRKSVAVRENSKYRGSEPLYLSLGVLETGRRVIGLSEEKGIRDEVAEIVIGQPRKAYVKGCGSCSK